MLLEYLPEQKIGEAVADGSEDDKEAGKEIPEILKPLEGLELIDLHTGINNSGSANAYLPLLRIFYTSMEDNAGELNRLYDEKDVENYTIKVHALKSSAKIIGAAAFGEEAQKLEDAGKSGDLAYIEQTHAAFIEDYLSFKEPLSEVFDSGAEEERPEADPELMTSVYAELHSAAEDMDCGRLQTIFKEMDAYTIPEADAEVWRKVREAAGKFDYDGVVQALDEGKAESGQA